MGCGLSTPEPPHRPLRRDDRMIYWKTKKQLEEEAAEQQRRKELEQSRTAGRLGTETFAWLPREDSQSSSTSLVYLTRSLVFNSLHRGRSLAHIVRKYHARAENFGESTSSVDDSKSSVADSASTDAYSLTRSVSGDSICNAYAKWLNQMQGNGAPMAGSAPNNGQQILQKRDSLGEWNINGFNTSAEKVQRFETLKHVRVVPSKPPLKKNRNTTTNRPAAPEAFPSSDTLSLSGEVEVQDGCVSDADARILIGPAEVYERHFGAFFCTGDSPFVLEPERTRGTTGRPSPQPNLEGPPLRRLAGRERCRFVGAMYVARRVPSPNWAMVERQGKMRTVRNDMEGM